MEEPTSITQQQASGRRPLLVAPPPDNGPKRFTFRIRRRGFSFRGSPSLLIGDYLGIWSVAHRRYIGRTHLHRYYELRADLDPVHKIYTALVQERGMHRWPQFRRVAGEIVALRHKLIDMYWDARPAEKNARTVLFYQELRRARRAKLAARVTASVALVVAVLGFVLLRVVRLGWYGGWANLCIGSAYLVAVYLLDSAWHAYDRSLR